MCDAFLIVVTVFLATALGRIDRFVDREDDVGDRNLSQILGEAITAPWTPYAANERSPPQLAEQLLKIGQRDFLALADLCKCHRATAMAHAEIDHRRDRKPSFRRQPHNENPLKIN